MVQKYYIFIGVLVLAVFAGIFAYPNYFNKSVDYLNNKFNNQQIYCRFDVVACSGPLDSIKIEWFKNAFYANYTLS